MTGRYQRTFFDAARPESETKLRIYESYLTPWSTKVVKTSPTGRVWVVDGFAGRGRYRNGTPGSPEIAMQRAKAIAAGQGAGPIQCLFGDSKPANWKVLYELKGLYPEASAMILEGDFWRRVDDVIDLVGSSPTLVFIDPFGLAGIGFQSLERLVSSIPRLDLIVNFRSPAVHRLAPQRDAQVSRAVGSSDWTVDSISRVFCRNLQRAGGFLQPATLTVRRRFGGAVRSELILAARHPAAYELWNDQAVMESERLTAQSGSGPPPRDSAITDVRPRLLSWAQGRRSWQRPDAVNWHVVHHCGDAHSGAIKRAHASLVADGSFRRHHADAAIDKDWFSSA